MELTDIIETNRCVIRMYLGNNMDLMKDSSPKYWDLAIVDPPFGIGQNWSKDRKAKFYKHRNNFNNTPPRRGLL